MLISKDDRLIFEKSSSGRIGAGLPAGCYSGKTASSMIDSKFKRQHDAEFPEVAEPEVVRHYVNLSRKNFSIDTHFYPLGSCTMKYNPKLNEWAASQDGFSQVHPHQTEDTLQGYLQVLYELEGYLKAMTGMDRFTLQPAAGAQGELTGMMLVHAYHHGRGDTQRRKVLVPDSSHGTNPATAALLGYEVVTIKSDTHGRVDLGELKKNLDETSACLMLTNPNTLGLFESDILEITKAVHDAGALLYYDGANLNALLGIARPGDMGFDIVHLNLHKTFSTPHGGGGPGAGPVGVKAYLIPYLPHPLVDKVDHSYGWTCESKDSVGRVKSFFGNAGMLLRAWVYITTLGRDGIKKISEDAVINANYLKEKLKDVIPVAVDEVCMHEFVLTLKAAKSKGIHSGDVGKRLLDYGYHAPTVHFPLVVDEAMMIEPTESESKETLDLFVTALRKIAREIDESPELVLGAPWTMPIGRPDEVKAARNPILTYRDVMRDKEKSKAAQVGV